MLNIPSFLNPPLFVCHHKDRAKLEMVKTASLHDIFHGVSHWGGITYSDMFFISRAEPELGIFG